MPVTAHEMKLDLVLSIFVCSRLATIGWTLSAYHLSLRDVPWHRMGSEADSKNLSLVDIKRWSESLSQARIIPKNVSDACAATVNVFIQELRASKAREIPSWI